MGCLLMIIIVALAYLLSWAITIGLIKLVCFCFGIVFSLKVATGIWIILCILQSVFTSQRGD